MSTRRSFTLPETSLTQRTTVGERILIGRDAGYTQPVATPDGIPLALIAYIPLPELFKLVPEPPCPSPPSITAKQCTCSPTTMNTTIFLVISLSYSPPC